MISKISFKLFIGFVLSCTIVFSVIQIGNSIQTLLNRFENGWLLGIICFSLVLVICFFLLFLLFRNSLSSYKSATHNIAISSEVGIDLQILSANFIEGFIEGLASKKHSQKNQV